VSPRKLDHFFLRQTNASKTSLRPCGRVETGARTVSNAPTVRKPVRAAVRWCTFQGITERSSEVID
jgi:hypothetical protein